MLTGKRIVVGSVVALTAALLVGIPTGIVETDWYTRMTPVTWWSYPAWLLSALLTGALAATYVGPRLPSNVEQSGKTLGANLLTTLAVGCPICNKLVVTVLGINGALTWFAPAQPLLAGASLGLLGYALSVRIKGLRSCPAPRALAMSPSD